MSRSGGQRMNRTNKPLDRQVVVITGASSGIGLATARMAVERGASVVRVHDVRETVAALAVWRAMAQQQQDAEDRRQ